MDIQPGKLLIGDEWVPAKSGRTFATINPATERELTQVAEAGPEDVDRAVIAARRALEEGPWSRTSPRERAKLLSKLAAKIREKINDIAHLESLDSGKTITDASRIEIPLAADVYEYYAGWADKFTGETLPMAPGHFAYTVREPVGVIAQIVPWNFPFLLASWKVAPALAMGNVVILKPAEQTPLTALKLGELALEVGFPPGVLNVLPGFGAVAGAALVKHPGVDKVAFTGSTAVGKEIMKSAADSLKRVSLELGGKSPNIVFADSDVEVAARAASGAIFFNKGEVCSAGSRLLVQASVYDAVLEKLTAQMAKLKQGDPLDPKTRLGPQVSAVQRDRVMRYVEAGSREGARLVTGGKALPGPGYFVAPTVFADVQPNMTIAREEIFGPVLSVLRFDDVEHAVRLANDSAYGLAAAVWTKDVSVAHRVARGIKAGLVWVNTYGDMDPAVPFGGFKQSGFGRELGQHALELYTELKTVWMRV